VRGGAAAEGEHRIGAGQQAGDGGVLQVAERGFAVFGEDARDRAADLLFDHVVAVGERQAELGRHEAADGRLTRAHEADDDDHQLSRSVTTARRART
jgi:hypothetical protein